MSVKRRPALIFPITRQAMSEAAARREEDPGALRLDAYAAASLLRIAIRRGEADLAERAAVRLYRLRGTSVWRHLLFSASGDVGVGDLDV
jgi:hypothetical protein